MAEIKCDLCKYKVTPDDMFKLGKWIFHEACFNIVLYRLRNFMPIILVTQEEFDEWIEDDGY